MRNRTVLKLFGIIAPIFTWIVSALIPGRKAGVAAAECANKCKIMALVQNLESYMDPEGKTPLQDVIERCYSLGPFPALWAVEGVGKDLAEWHMGRNENPAGILTNAQLDPQWHKALLMLHAGLGLGFAKYQMERLKGSPTEQDVRLLVTRTVDLCRNNSRPGYYGAAIESLGLVSRFMRDAAFCRQVHKVLTEYAPDSVAFFWRGVGRCLYFHPINFMPGFSKSMRAIGLCRAEAPNAELLLNLLAGVAWPLAIVNMTHPEVMESALVEFDDYFSSSPAFINGVMASVVMRYDTTPNDPLIPRFMNHQPAADNPELSRLWATRIKEPIEKAVNVIQPALKQHNRLDEVFRYQSLEELVERLEGQGQRASG